MVARGGANDSAAADNRSARRHSRVIIGLGTDPSRALTRGVADVSGGQQVHAQAAVAPLSLRETARLHHLASCTALLGVGLGDAVLGPGHTIPCATTCHTDIAAIGAAARVVDVRRRDCPLSHTDIAAIGAAARGGSLATPSATGSHGLVLVVRSVARVAKRGSTGTGWVGT